VERLKGAHISLTHHIIVVHDSAPVNYFIRRDSFISFRYTTVVLER
jgi:hypothetical protein